MNMPRKAKTSGQVLMLAIAAVVPAITPGVIPGAGFNPTSTAFAAPQSGRSSTVTSSSRSSRSTSSTSSSKSSSSTSSSTSTSTKTDDISLLEGALGRSLTDKEKEAVTTAATARDTAIAAAQQTFLTQVAAIFGLTATELQTQIQTVFPNSSGLLLSNVEKLLTSVLGRTLTTTEQTALHAAMETRGTALKAANETYRAAVAAALGLTVAELQAKIRAYLDSNSTGSQGQGNRQGGGKGGGKGGNCDPSSGTTGTGTTGTGTTGTGTTGTRTTGGVTTTY